MGDSHTAEREVGGVPFLIESLVVLYNKYCLNGPESCRQQPNIHGLGMTCATLRVL